MSIQKGSTLSSNQAPLRNTSYHSIDAKANALRFNKSKVALVCVSVALGTAAVLAI